MSAIVFWKQLSGGNFLSRTRGKSPALWHRFRISNRSLPRLSLRDLGSLMNRFYAAITEAVLRSEGDVDRFCGPSVVAYYGFFREVQETVVVAAANVALQEQTPRSERDFSVQIGLGLCRGTMLYGRFDLSNRNTITAFGPPAICAERLSAYRTWTSCLSRVGGTDFESGVCCTYLVPISSVRRIVAFRATKQRYEQRREERQRQQQDKMIEAIRPLYAKPRP